MYCTVQYIKDNKAPQLIAVLNEVAHIYTYVGFKLATLYADMEFKTIKAHVTDAHDVLLAITYSHFILPF